MRRAGSAVAALARALRPHGRTAWIACGPGNNGGDGLEAALQLLAAGLRVEVTLVADPARLPGDARDALARAQAAGVQISAERPSSDSPDIAIDALLGMGSNRAPGAALADCIVQLNASRCPVLAVDLPSGLNADTGQPFGEHCARPLNARVISLTPAVHRLGPRIAGGVWLDDSASDASARASHRGLSAAVG